MSQGDLLAEVTPAQEFDCKPGVPELRHELLLAERIRGHKGPLLDVFGGDTDVLERMQRFRRAILELEQG